MRFTLVFKCGRCHLNMRCFGSIHKGSSVALLYAYVKLYRQVGAGSRVLVKDINSQDIHNYTR